MSNGSIKNGTRLCYKKNENGYAWVTVTEHKDGKITYVREGKSISVPDSVLGSRLFTTLQDTRIHGKILDSEFEEHAFILKEQKPEDTHIKDKYRPTTPEKPTAKIQIHQRVNRLNDQPQKPIKKTPIQEELPNYISGETILHVRVNDEWKEATFFCFGIKNGGRVIHVLRDGVRFFYAFPSEYVKESYEEVEAVVKKEKQKNTLFEQEKIEAVAIRNAFSQLPASHVPVKNHDSELAYEHEYHNQVNKKIDQLDAYARAYLDHADRLEGKAIAALTEANIAERESDAGFDPFNMGYSKAKSLFNESGTAAKKAHDRINELFKIKQEPYFARMDCGSNLSDLHTVYLGNSDLDEYVKDWRNKAYGNAYYYSDMLKDSKEVVIALKRVITIRKAELLDYEDEINRYHGDDSNSIDSITSAVTDSLFLTLLEESRRNEAIHDIVRTIQQNQYSIITSDFNRDVLVNGCAGSGKTMIMYHRLSFMAYNDIHNFNARNVFAITPSTLYSSLSGDLIDKLKLEEISNLTFGETVLELIERYKTSRKMFGTTLLPNKAIYNGINSNDLLNSEKYNDYLRRVNAVYDDPADFADWFLNAINSELSSCKIPVIEEVEFYKKLSKHTLPYVLDERKRQRFDGQIKNKVWSLTEYSWENINNTKTITSDSDRMRMINKYRNVINRFLRDKPSYTKVEGKLKEYEGVSLFDPKKEIELVAALTFLKLEKTLQDFQEFYLNEKDNSILLYICEYVWDKTYGDREEPLLKALYTLRTLAEHFGSLTDERTLLFIDEFQNYSPFELETLGQPFSNCVYNLFGDYDQKLDEKGIDSSYFKEQFDGEEFTIAENYRNAFEITEYINDALGKTMLPIGLHGNVEETMLDACIFGILGRTAIIVHDTEEAADEIRERIPRKLNIINKNNMLLDPEKINLISVADTKGLEFETVYVMDKGMTPNERYVAYTRALKDLTIIKQ